MPRILEGFPISNGMKIIEGIKLKGRPAEIPDCSREELPEFFLEMGFKTGIEIGVYTGTYTESFAKVGLRIYGVDPWLAYPDNALHSLPKHQKRLDLQYEQTKARLAPYSNCTLIRKTSMDAVKDFNDVSLDFVYIDGNHLFKYVIEDIWEWSKKIKVGGVIAGHDYVFTRPKSFHVHEAVDAYTTAFRMDFFVLGRKNGLEGEKRDQPRSWMWIKKAG